MEVFLNMQLRQSFWAAIIVLTTIAAPLAAHHSFAAEYDGTKQVTMSGKVTKVEWMNPHAFFYLDVKDEKTGQVANWAFELNSPNYLMRSGWTKASLKLDDLVTVTGALSRDGNKQVNASTVKLSATGKTLFAGSSDPNAPR
jgi:hypothetical protein